VAHVVVKVARNAGLVALFIVAAMLGILSGVMFAYAGDLPQVSALDNYSPSTITRIYASGGQVIGEFATQRRVVVGYDEINPLLRQAIIATEDAEFDRHFGVNIWRIFVAAATDVIERRRAQGASTLTQQLARNLKEQFGLNNEKSFERKIREAILAIQIEKRYTKKEIFTIYCNQMYLGHGAYGVEAASRLYFQKSNKQLSLEEAALIAGIFQTPERQSPFLDMKRATSRRNIVLQRMADEHYITQTQADAARDRALLRRGSAQAPRETVQRQGALRERPQRPDHARRRPAGAREQVAGARPTCL
jgi:penicillin-binding protein 1A